MHLYRTFAGLDLKIMIDQEQDITERYCYSTFKHDIALNGIVLNHTTFMETYQMLYPLKLRNSQP
jgi:hypothetical protein